MRDVARDIGAHLTNHLAKNNAMTSRAVVVRSWRKSQSLQVFTHWPISTHEKLIDFFTESMKISLIIS
jgi:hypothetical protein